MPSPQPSPMGEGAGCCWVCPCRLFSIGYRLLLVFRSSEMAAAFCSLSCGRGFVADAENSVWSATVLPSPQPSPTGVGAGCCRICPCRLLSMGCRLLLVFRSSETAAELCLLSCGRGLGRGFVAAVGNSVWSVTVLPSPSEAGIGCCWLGECGPPSLNPYANGATVIISGSCADKKPCQSDTGLAFKPFCCKKPSMVSRRPKLSAHSKIRPSKVV